jgi:hypothetical protein
MITDKSSPIPAPISREGGGQCKVIVQDFATQAPQDGRAGTEMMRARMPLNHRI